jgi:phosphatidylglycerophosphatase A
MSDKLVKMLSTWFYIGDIPGAPGTVASAAGALLAIIFSSNIILYLLILCAVIIMGLKVCGLMEGILDRKDPGCVVIDEVAGIMVAFFLLPLNIAVIFTAFFLFRAFDMFKIYPVNKFEQLQGSMGVMMDDIIAGVYTNIVMQVAVRWAGVI